MSDFGMMAFVAVQVVPYSRDWRIQFERVAKDLRRARRDVSVESIEHIGSTSVPGLAAKPVLHIDVAVQAGQVVGAVAALEEVGYCLRGDMGVIGREALPEP